jgi:uncharacterized protein YggE
MIARKQTYRTGLPVLTFALVGAALLSGCSTLSPAGSAQNVLSVTGYGTASAAPDLAYVNLGVFAIGEDVGTTVDNANRIMEVVMQAITDAGVAESDMQTSGFNVWSEERYDQGPFVEEGGNLDPAIVYRVENSLRVTVREVNTLGDVIQAGLDAGANRVHSVNFSIDDTSALEQEARALAVEDARARANALADEMGVTLGEPVSLSESPAGGVPFAEAAAYGIGGGGGGPPISGGELSVSLQVHVGFKIEQQ